VSDPTPPTLPPELAADWAEASSTTETVMRVRSMVVSVATRVYDDERLREAVAGAGGPDATLRFCFASECSVPGTDHSGALRKLVTSRAKSGFTERLEERGFEAVRETSRRTLRVDEDEVTAFGYEARCPLAGVTIGVEGWLTVRPGESGTFFLVGGAYPTGVLSADDDAAAAAVSEHVDPESFRAGLFSILRSVP
jgi:hypothetical protein